MENNIIKNYGNKLNLEESENYLLCGALANIMLTKGRPDFDYWFFSGVTGDTFTQVFSRNFKNYYDCLSSAVFGKPHLDKIFNACGYEYTLIDNMEFFRNTEKYLHKIKEWIDKDVPVIVKDTEDSWYSIAVGYENNGNSILIFDMLGSTPQECNFNLSEESNYSLVFVGDMVKEISLAEVYRNAVFDISKLLSKESTSKVSFGKQAFIDWSKSLLAGRNDFLLDYIDWVGINAHMTTFLNRSADFNPNLKNIIEQLNVFAVEHANLYRRLSDNAEKIINKRKRRIVKEMCKELDEISVKCQEIVDLLEREHV